jgi:putative ABC transport system substrate-binding protein
MMKSILYWLLSTVFLTTAPLAQAQQPRKIPLIGILSGVDAATAAGRFEAIQSALAELGYKPGQNIAYEHRIGWGKSDPPAERAAELVRLKVDIIVVAGGLPVVQAAKDATKSIPIVMGGRGIDPVVSGMVASLARPGGNVTGLTTLSRELGGKRLELLKDTAPKLARVAVLFETENPGSLRELKDVLPSAASALKLTLQPWEVRDESGSFEKAFATTGNQRPDGLYVTSSPLLTANLKRIVDLTLKSRMLSIGSNVLYVEAGGLMTYDGDVTESYRRIAYYVDRLLKGAKPADLPVEQPMKFEFIVNLKTAKQIGVTIPPNVLVRADRVIR